MAEAGRAAMRAYRHDDRRGVVLWACTVARGGMGSYVRTMQQSPLWSAWAVRLIVTHRDGTPITKIITFAMALARFLWLRVTANPVLLHLHCSTGGSFVRKYMLLRLAKTTGVPVVLHVHSGEFMDFYGDARKPVRAAIRDAFRTAATVVALGGLAQQKVTRIWPEAAVVTIPNGFPVPAQPPPRAQQAPVHVVALARIGPLKGSFRLLHAWRQLLEAWEPTLGPRPRLTMAGDGEVTEARRLAVELGVDDSVTIPGWIVGEELADLLASAHVMVLPSTHEGQPMAILEAMAQGICVVASAVGGIPDLITDGRDGLLVPPADQEALVAALRRVIVDSAERERLGRAGHQRALRGLERAVADLDELYGRLNKNSRRQLRRVPSVSGGSQ